MTKKEELIKIFRMVYPSSKIDTDNINQELFLISGLIYRDYNYFIDICYNINCKEYGKGFYYKVIDILNNEIIINDFNVYNDLYNILIDAELLTLEYIKNGRN